MSWQNRDIHSFFYKKALIYKNQTYDSYVTTLLLPRNKCCYKMVYISRTKIYKVVIKYIKIKHLCSAEYFNN